MSNIKKQIGIVPRQYQYIDSGPYKVYRRATDELQTFRREKLKNGISTEHLEYGLGILETLLALRFLFDLFNASTLNLIAQLVYAVTYVFTAPIWGLFGRNPSYALTGSQLETLAAMLVYPVVILAIIAMIKLAKRHAVRREELRDAL